MGRHVLSDMVVIFGLEQSCRRTESSRLSGSEEPLRRAPLQRPGIFDASRLSGAALDEKTVGYDSQAGAFKWLLSYASSRRYTGWGSDQRLASPIAMKRRLPFPIPSGTRNSRMAGASRSSRAGKLSNAASSFEQDFRFCRRVAQWFWQ
jgi:hypothetical protein